MCPNTLLGHCIVSFCPGRLIAALSEHRFLTRIALHFACSFIWVRDQPPLQPTQLFNVHVMQPITLNTGQNQTEDYLKNVKACTVYLQELILSYSLESNLVDAD